MWLLKPASNQSPHLTLSEVVLCFNVISMALSFFITYNIDDEVRKSRRIGRKSYGVGSSFTVHLVATMVLIEINPSLQ